MKPLRMIAALAVLSLLLTGCGSQNEPTGKPDPVPVQTEAPAPANANPAPDAELDEDFGDIEDEFQDDEPAAPPVDESAFEWRVSPFLEAEDISPLSIGPGLGAYGDFNASGYLLITLGGKVGLMTHDGSMILEPECTHAYCYVQEDGDCHIIFTNGAPDSGDRICFCVTTGALIRTAEDVCTLCGGQLKNAGTQKAAVYDTENGIFGLLPAESVWGAAAGSKIKLDGNFTTAEDDEQPGAVARSIKLPEGFSEYAPSGEGVLNEFIGVVRAGRAMTGFKYTKATDFKDGVAAFCSDGKWGYLTTAGRMVLPFEYDAVFAYSGAKNGKTEMLPYLPSEGYIALNQGSSAGYSNLSGKCVIPVGSFAAARPVYDGQAWVKDKTSGLWGMIALGAAVTGERPVMHQTEPDDEPDEEPQRPTQYHAENGDGWQQAYAELLRTDGTGGDTLQFSLCMVDGDDVPELVLHWYDRNGFVQENEDVEMYTYYDGRLIYLGNVSCDGYCTCKYLPQKHIVLVGGMREDVALYDFMQLENGALTTVCSFNMVMDGTNVSYMIDGNKCSKDTYVSKWKEYYNGDVSYDGGMYRNTEENIVGILGVEAHATEG